MALTEKQLKEFKEDGVDPADTFVYVLKLKNYHRKEAETTYTKLKKWISYQQRNTLQREHIIKIKHIWDNKKKNQKPVILNKDIITLWDKTKQKLLKEDKKTKNGTMANTHTK